VNPRVSRYTDDTEPMRALGVFGPTARHVVEAVTGVSSTALSILPAYAHVRVELDGTPVTVARTPEVMAEGYELFLPAGRFEDVWGRAERGGAVPCGLAAWEIARVEAGRPEWGLDMDESTLVQEANLDTLQAVSYTKGCYVGQEVVARVHFKGHVNRHLRGLRISGTTSVPTGAALFGEGDKSVGEVRTSVVSPRLGPIALGMIRREVGFGATVSARWEGGEARAEVCALPLPAE
jgi:tRNA-modifying protein YgfZ